jgi:hypothetical protein
MNIRKSQAAPKEGEVETTPDRGPVWPRCDLLSKWRSRSVVFIRPCEQVLPRPAPAEGYGEVVRCLVIEFFSPSAFRRFAFEKFQGV